MKKVIILRCMSRYKELALTGFAAHVLASMEGNINFPNPDPTLNELMTAKSKFDASLLKTHEGTKSDTSLKKQMRAELERCLQLIASYVQRCCQNNATILLSSGYGMYPDHVKKRIPSVPLNVSIKDGYHSGEIIVKYKKSKNAAGSVARYTTDLKSGIWSITESSFNSKIYISDLERGKDIWVQVKSYNANGSSEWSDPAVWMVR